MDGSSEVTIRRLGEADAAALVRCFVRCYGDTYPSDHFHDPGRLRARIADGTLRSVGAIARDGTLVGHMGLTVRHRRARASEAGNTVVDPAYRGRGLLGQLGGALAELCRGEGFIGYVHYPTTAHDIMQRTSVRGDGVETGLMLDYIPAETDYRGIEQGVGRLAATVAYLPFSRAPERRVFLPTAYRELITDLYNEAMLERGVAPPRDTLTRGATRALRTLHVRRSLLQVHVERAGRDIAKCLDSSTAVTHVDLCLDDPGVGAAVSILRDQRFFFCAVMPEFAHTDVLRLQRLESPSPESFAPKLANEGARRLLSFIAGDTRH